MLLVIVPNLKKPVAGRRNLEQVWYTGKIQGQVAAYNICGTEKEYDPGHWFNSAKFLDIEYQTYGWVFPKLREGETDFYWEHNDGKKCLHFVWNENTGKFIGLNTFGIRLRHKVFDKILREEKDIDYVIENLAAANFDPEHYKTIEADVIAAYNKKTGKKLKSKAKRGIRAALSLFK